MGKVLSVRCTAIPQAPHLQGVYCTWGDGTQSGAERGCDMLCTHSLPGLPHSCLTVRCPTVWMRKLRLTEPNNRSPNVTGGIAGAHTQACGRRVTRSRRGPQLGASARHQLATLPVVEGSVTASRMGFPRSPRWCRGTGGRLLSDCQLTLLEAQLNEWLAACRKQPSL